MSGMITRYFAAGAGPPLALLHGDAESASGQGDRVRSPARSAKPVGTTPRYGASSQSTASCAMAGGTTCGPSNSR